MASVGILGAGKIGKALKVMLDGIQITSVLADQHASQDVEQVDVSDAASLSAFVRKHDAIVSALPFLFNKSVADECFQQAKSYFDFTEDTATTAHVGQLGLWAAPGQVFAPQCGLAPGAINIIGASIARQFDAVRTLDLRVGALPLSANNQMKYYLSWSSAGLINEYLQPCDALYRGMPVKTQPLDGLEEIVIDGVLYEAFNTSGGVATMCDTMGSLVQNLTYKTIRYPGHRDHMHFVIKDLNLEERPDLLTQIFEQEVPLTRQDVVLIYVNAVGTKDGKLVQKSYVRKIEHDAQFTAIQKSTAAGMAAVIELWSQGKLTGSFVRQEMISVQDFLRTQWGRAVYGV